MAKKIFLSPSNQTDNKYAYGNTTEAVVCGKIADALEAALKRHAFEVKKMHYYSMEDKVAAANAWGADLYVPLHTNAYNGKVGGTRIFYYSKESAGYEAAKYVYAALASLSIGTSDNISPYPALYEVQYPKAPTVYVEAEFHDNAEYAKWIIEHIEDIAEAICKGICEYYGVKYSAPVVAAATLYRVQVGAYSKRENAENMLAKLKAAGFTDAYIRT